MKTAESIKDAQDTLVDLTRNVAYAQMLKFEAGHQIFCPACSKVMDWQETVSITFYKADPEGKIAFSKALCGACYDKVGQGLKNAQDEAEKRFGPITVEICDGREWLDELTRIEYVIAPDKRLRTVLHKTGVKNVLSYAVTCPRVPWADWFIYQEKPDLWHFVEPLTGLGISRASTQKGAVLTALRALLKAGKEKFEKRRQKYLKQSGTKTAKKTSD